MIARILLAVDDSPAGLAATDVAMRLAQTCQADVRAVTVLLDGEFEARLASGAQTAEAPEALRARRGGGQNALLHHVITLGVRHDVVPDTVALVGAPAPCILAEARDYQPDVIVIGRSGGRRSGEPYVGSEVRHVLEFADQPVLVVPAARGQSPRNRVSPSS
ncbi:MAG: universal stress protein [Jiangellales bacterium]